MTGATDEILIAEGRSDEIEFDTANVFLRSKLYDTIPHSDEGKLKGLLSTSEFWLEQNGATKAKEGMEETKKHFKDETGQECLEKEVTGYNNAHA